MNRVCTAYIYIILPVMANELVNRLLWVTYGKREQNTAPLQRIMYYYEATTQGLLMHKATCSSQPSCSTRNGGKKEREC